MQKAEQLETFLIGALAAPQDWSQQAIDAFRQHAASPSAAQHLAQGIPSCFELFGIQQGCGLIQALVPNGLSSLLLE